MNPLIIGTLNDGIEPQFPGTDVPRLAQYAQVIFGQELDRRLADQLPDWMTTQGSAAGDSDMGIAIKSDLMDILGAEWVPTSGSRNALCIRADFLGSPLSLITAHRASKTWASRWPEFNAKLGALVKAEKDAGRLPIVGIDTNAAAPQDVADATKLNWVTPYPDSIVGFLVPGRVQVLGVATLAREGEHPPVIAMIKTPVPSS